MSQARRRKPLSESVKASLKKKAEGTRFFYGELAEVWAMGRVNSYMTGKGGARTADAKIYSKYQKKR